MRHSFHARQLANWITLTRIIGVGFIFWMTPFHTNLGMIWTAIIYTLICLTDFFDGWVARRMGIVSDLGKILDPIADKILVLVFLPLLEMGAITSFPVFLILAREFTVMGLRVYAAKKGQLIPAGFPGKLKTALTLPICGILLARVPVTTVPLPPYLFPLEFLRAWIFSWPTMSVLLLIWAMVGITLWSMWGYVKGSVWQLILDNANGDELKARQQLKILIPNAVTVLNLGCGIFATFYAWLGEFHMAVLLVLTGSLLDAVDGKLARRLNAFSNFGAKMDSRADFVNFGIAPAMVIFRLFSIQEGVQMTFLGLFLGLLYYASVHYRLRRFNQTGHADYFEGMPSPVGAGIVVVAAISNLLSILYVFPVIVLFSSALMISRIPYPHLDIMNKGRFLRILRIPTLLFLCLTILQLLNIHIARDYYTYEALFAMGLVYVSLPLFLKRK